MRHRINDNLRSTMNDLSVHQYQRRHPVPKADWYDLLFWYLWAAGLVGFVVIAMGY